MKLIILTLLLGMMNAHAEDYFEKENMVDSAKFYASVLNSKKVIDHVTKRMEKINAGYAKGNYQFLGISESRAMKAGVQKVVIKYGNIYNIEDQRCVVVSKEETAIDFEIGKEGMCLSPFVGN